MSFLRPADVDMPRSRAVQAHAVINVQALGVERGRSDLKLRIRDPEMVGLEGTALDLRIRDRERHEGLSAVHTPERGARRGRVDRIDKLAD